MKKNEPDSVSDDSTLEKRRSAVKKILAAGSITAGAGFAGSSKWKTPVVDSVLLPAHAQSSVPTISGQIGASDTTGLLDLFMSPAYAEDDAPNDLVGGCIDITIVDTSVTVMVTLNNGVSDSRTGTLNGTSFSLANVNGFPVNGSVDNANSPTTCSGVVGPVAFSAVVNGSCSVIHQPSCDSGTPCPE